MTDCDLAYLLSSIGIKADVLGIEVKGLTADSRTIKPGDVFFAMSGFEMHGMDFSYQAQRAGAVAILAENVKTGRAKPAGRQKPLRIPVIEIEDLSAQAGIIASAFYSNPSSDIKVIAITGTNGKTSVAWLLYQALGKLGKTAAYIGTLGAIDAAATVPLANTTPPAIDIQRLLADYRDKRIEYVCLEASSHALDQGRLNGTEVTISVFTNLSRDHLDYHQTEAAYFDSKQRLFNDFETAKAVININDDAGQRLLVSLPSNQQHLSYAVNSNKAELNASSIELSSRGIAFDWHYHGYTAQLKSKLMGSFNVENILAVIGCLLSFGYSYDEVNAALDDIQTVPGRMNAISMDGVATVVVDYAHTPDALEKALLSLKNHNPSELWCVFGCGGDRDKGKRSQMGEIADSHADQVVLTDDNPRMEDGDSIIRDIQLGIKKEVIVIRDRRKAIHHALEQASSKDIILIAGKGHESTQHVSGEILAFNDEQVVTEWLEAKQ